MLFTRTEGGRCRAPGQEPPQSSSMGLTWSTKKKGKAGFSRHGDTEGEVSALWPPYTHLLSDSKCALVWHTSLAHALQFSQAERQSSSGLCCAGVRGSFPFWEQSLQTCSWGSFFPAQLRHRVLSPCCTDPAMSFLICLFLLLHFLYTVCELYYGHCLRFQKPRVCRDGDLVMGWIFSSLRVVPGIRHISALFCGQPKARGEQQVSKFLFTRAHGCVRVCPFNPTEKMLRCAQKLQNCRLTPPHWCFPRGAGGKESTCESRRSKRWVFDPWVGKIPWSRKWQSTPVFLSGEFHGQRSLVAIVYGDAESDMTEQLGSDSHCDLLYLFFTLIFFSPLPSRQRRELDNLCVSSMSLFSMIIPQRSQN